ncbi:CTLH/CRA C-terminal to lish motif domain-containing protein [Radiomyces spectabilis]|uniref:CTLH/CRA C-terminal to lish motif domain-containing protein n=1 Tax=Radiomyces spectabilis TaxID=64574 RepID=UPI00221EA8BE|nr:CTLH/CRA C-terminal to lish motif domain-containing protein [Radiomyces spectabilis]KAI8374136.1 CTLH/CRA C-terminal to lish motif domain-containing protein [Radiomyces spectabilis]
MEALIAGSNEFLDRQIHMQDTIATKLEAYKGLLQKAKDTVAADPSKAQYCVQQLEEKTKKLSFHRSQKEFQNALLKFGKDVERRFKQDLSAIYHPEAFAGKEHLITQALITHFIHQGQFDLCDVFMREAAIDDTDPFAKNIANLKQLFGQMYSILREMEESQDLTNAIQWAEEHHDRLASIGSSLEFNLHRLHVIKLLCDRRKVEAIMYSQKHFTAFGDKHFTDIKRLMASLIYDDIQSSPYADLCSPTLWVDARMEFQRDFCSLLTKSAESPLYASVLVGTTALPVIMKLYKIMSAKKTEWSQQNELPVEIPLDENLRFHSVFACPVSKEQATDDNPPMRMPCGHVICKESLTRLSRSSRYGRNSARFKCPYCPSESSMDQATLVYF